jgi:hypothetical protein
MDVARGASSSRRLMGVQLHPSRVDAPRIAFLGAYPPRRCGGAMYTHDLRAALVRAWPGTSGPVIAVTDRADPQRYPVEVRAKIERERPSDYARGAAVVRASGLDALIVQHALGAFGGPAGGLVLRLAENAGARVITTLHALLADPDEEQRRVVARLAAASAALVVQSGPERSLLRERYDLDLDHVHVISPGAPVGSAYASLIDGLRGRRATRPTPTRVDEGLRLHELTDETALRPDVGDGPDARHGYRLDDNAGALGLCAVAQGTPLGERLSGLRGRYVSFVDGAFDHRRGWFRSVMDFERRWLKARASDTCQGHALWSLGVCASRFAEGPLGDWADALFRRAVRGRPLTRHFRASAAALMGAAAHFERGDAAHEARLLRDVHLDVLLGGFHRSAEAGWPWFEPALERVNASLPHAVIVGGVSAGHERAVSVGLCALEWLLGTQRDERGRFAPEGAVGGPRDPPRSRGVQGAEEAGAVVRACVAAYRAIPDARWLVRARWAFSWFHEREGSVDERRGARATLAYLTAALELSTVAPLDGASCASP